MKKYKVAGIITEYNPFHNGHIYHIQETKRITQCDVLVCVMSGNFVQRGESAIIDKWERTKIALQYGVDILIELPFIYATQSANHFAMGAVRCLQLAEVDAIVFGSESNDLELLRRLSKQEINISIEKDKGISSSIAYASMYGTLPPNDILGLNYLRYIQTTNITPITIKRTNTYHSTTLTSSISSASAIRHAVFHNQDVTHTTPMQNLSSTHQFSNYYPWIKYTLVSQMPNHIASLFLVDEGIEHRFIKHAKQAEDYAHFIQMTLTKRYTKANIQRSLVHILQQTTKQEVNTLPTLDHIRILGFSEVGQAYLKQIKENVNIVTSVAKLPSPYKEMELKATQIYNLVLPLHEQVEANKKELQAPIIHIHTKP